ncbi:MAG: lysophospholipid acyltransferase family protein [Pseudomonadota bacterium]
MTWMSDEEPPMRKIGPMGWLRVLVRGVPMAIVTFGGLLILLIVRLIERPIFGAQRPVTPRITQYVCRFAFWILGMGHVVRGTPMQDIGAAVANHASWLDIFALNAKDRIYFVAKSEVAHWPAIGWLARATGTMFVVRDRAEAVKQTIAMEQRLQLGHRLLFFPEGTSTDGQRVLPFKPTLFQSFLADGLRDDMRIQPITVSYYAPVGEDARFYGWWGDTDFAQHLLKALAAPKHGRVVVEYHDPVAVCDHPNRKKIATILETKVRSRLLSDLGKPIA